MKSGDLARGQLDITLGCWDKKEVTVEGTFSLCTGSLCKTWRREKFSIGEKE